MLLNRFERPFSHFLFTSRAFRLNVFKERMRQNSTHAFDLILLADVKHESMLVWEKPR